MNKKITTKLYTWLGALFLVLFMSMGATAQGLETFENATIGGSYSDGSFQGDNGILWTYVHSRDEATYGIDGKGIMLRRADEPSSISATISGGIGNFSVDTRKAFTGNSQRRVELVINDVVVSQFEPAFGDGADETTFEWSVEDINIPGDVSFEIRSFGAAGNQQIILDNISWTGYTSTDPVLSVGPASFSNFSYIDGDGPSSSREVTVSGSNLDPADGNITVTGSTNFEVSSDGSAYGSTFDIAYTGGSLASTTFYVRMKSGIAPGAVAAEDITVTLGALERTVEVSGQVNAVVSVADISELRTQTAGDGTVYALQSEAIVLGLENFRNRIFIRDGSGSINIWDDLNGPTAQGNVTTDYNEGDGISGLRGTLTVQNQMVVFRPVEDPGAASSTDNDTSPVVTTLSDLDASHTGNLVTIENVSFTTTGTFANGNNYNFEDATGTGVVRTEFFGRDYIGTPVPDEPVNLTGIVIQFNTTIQVVPRSLEDFAVPPTEFVTEWQRSTATENLPAWFASNRDRGIAYVNEGENHYILVASSAAFGATGNVYVLDALTGSDVGELDLSAYTGTGTMVVSDVMTSEDGKIFVTNFGQNQFHNFRVNMFDSITDTTPIEVVNDDTNAGATTQFARAATIIGNYAAGTATIYAISTGGDNALARYTQTGPGETFGNVEYLTLSAVGGTPQAAAVGSGAAAFYSTGSGQPVRKYNADGTLAGTISTDVLGSGAGKIAFLGSNEMGDEFIAVYDFPTNTARLVKVVGGDPTNAVAIASTPTLGSVTNVNGTGDITAVVEEDGSVSVFVMGTNNGIGAFSFDESLVIPPAATPDYAYVQLIHNSADPALAMVDVYVNSTEVPMFTNVAYRSATVFLGFEAGISHSIILTPAGQPVASGLEFDNLVFMADENYYAVVGGVIDPSQFAVNPSAVSTALIIDIISGALLVNPEGTQEVAFATYHGSTDAPGVDIAIRDVAVIAVNAMYTDVVDYVSAPADAYIIDIAPTGGDVLFSYSADFSTFGGQTAMVIASGFLTPSANKDGEEFALIAVLVDGTVVNLPLTSTDIESGIGLPDDFRLSQNYPNPFNPTTRIEFDMPVSGDVTLAVYDLLGRQVALLANENYAAGTHNIAFDASQLASGVYMYRLNVAGQTFTRKMTLVK
jgi:hypothetical protein